MAEKDVECASDQTKRRTVLIATDGSQKSLHAFEWYAEHLYRDTDKVLLAYQASANFNLPAAAHMGSPATIHAFMQKHENRVKEVFKAVEQSTQKYNIQHTLERLDTPDHKPGEAIVKAADQQDVDFIVIGSRGEGKVRRTVMGSVSDFVLHHSHVPVFICKHEDEHHKIN